MTASQMGSGGGRGAVHIERCPNLRQSEPENWPLLPRLSFLMDWYATVLDRSIKARPWNIQDADSFAGPDHRFLLHVPTVADVPIVPFVPSMVHLEQSVQVGDN